MNDSENKIVYFASDAHLGLDIHEKPIESEKRLVRWLNEIKPTAKALYLVGDMFDYWFEYKDVVPKGYVRFIGKLAEFVDDGIPVYMFTGNHDTWMFDYFEKEVGAVIYTDSIEIELDGKKFYIAHGDGLGDPSKSFRFMRKFFRNKFCQQLYKLIHPGLTMPFGYAWSRHNRKKKLGTPGEQYLGEEKEFLVQFAKKYSQSHDDIEYYIFGHRHIMLDLKFCNNKRIMILGDWITNFSYASWNGTELSLKKYIEDSCK